MSSPVKCCLGSGGFCISAGTYSPTDPETALHVVKQSVPLLLWRAFTATGAFTCICAGDSLTCTLEYVDVESECNIRHSRGRHMAC